MRARILFLVAVNFIGVSFLSDDARLLIEQRSLSLRTLIISESKLLR